MDEMDPVEAARNAAVARRHVVESTGALSEDPFRAGSGAPGGGAYSPRLYFHLSGANLSLSQIGRNESTQVPSTVPLLGGVIDRLKAAVHELALNYVRRLAERQMAMNVSLVRVLNEVVAQTQHDRQGQIQALEARVQALEARVTELEATLARRS